MICLQGVRKEFRQGSVVITALAGVDLEIARGEFVSIIGPSGSGKSTALYLIGGLDRPTVGEIVVDGQRFTAMREAEITLFRRRKIGFVFQFFNLLPTLDAVHNVALPLLLDGQAMADVRRRAEQLLELVGLGNRLRHRPDELSGGEMQRVAIARALVTNPAVLLADEPTGNLDSKAREEILELMRRANRDRGQTVVLVTHDPASAARADRLVRLKDGRIINDSGAVSSRQSPGREANAGP